MSLKRVQGVGVALINTRNLECSGSSGSGRDVCGGEGGSGRDGCGGSGGGGGGRGRGGHS